MAPWVLAIDFGTSSSCAAVWADGRAQELRIDGDVRVPSTVVLDEQGQLLAGARADNQAALLADRAERTPKRQLGTAAPLLLGGQPVAVEDAVGAVLRLIYEAAWAERGTPPTRVVLTHPARWSETRLRALRSAAARAGLTDPLLCPEPVAAAVHYASDRSAPGSLVAIYDLGGGTFDSALLRRTDSGFEVLGDTGGDEDLGGEQFDSELFVHLGDELAELDPELRDHLYESDELRWRRAAALLLAQCRAAKETLSSYPTTRVAIPESDEALVVTRAEFEALVDPDVNASVDELERTIVAAGVKSSDVEAIHLTGGSSRMPIVQRLLTARYGARVTTFADPKLIVALGAAAWGAEQAGLTGRTRPSAATPPPVVPPPVGPPPSSPPPVGPPPSAPPPVAPPPVAPPTAPPPVAPPSYATPHSPPAPPPTAPAAPWQPAPGPAPAATPVPSPAPARGGRRGLVIGAVAAALVVVLGVAAFVVLGGDSEPEAPPLSEAALSIEAIDANGSPGDEDAIINSLAATTGSGAVASGCTFDTLCTVPGLWFVDAGGSWEQVDPDELGSGTINSVTEFEGGFVGVGEVFEVEGTGEDATTTAADPALWRSTDGSSWEQLPADDFGDPDEDDDERRLFAVTVVGERLVAFLATIPPEGDIDVSVYVSDDGESWTETDTTTFDGISYAAGFEELDGQLVVVASTDVDEGGDADRDSVELFTTTDGESWDPVDVAGIDDGGLIFGTAVLGDRLYAAGPVDGGGAAVWVTDALGERWREVHQVDGPDQIDGLVALPGGLLALGSTGEGEDTEPAVWVSDDGTTWEEADLDGVEPGFWLGSGVAQDDTTVLAIGGVESEREDAVTRNIWEITVG